MRALAVGLALLAAGCASAPPAAAPALQDEEAPRSSRLALHVGARAFDGSDWEPVEHQGGFGLEFVHEAPDSVVGLEAAFFASGRTEDDYFVPPIATVDFRGRTSELSFGVHKEIRSQYAGIHPYVGGGLSVLRAELRGAEGGVEREEDGESAGLYLHGGLEFDASEALFLGLDLRLRGGTEIDLLGEDRGAGYGQVMVMLGVRF